MLVHIICTCLLISQCSSFSDRYWKTQGKGSKPSSDSLKALTLLTYSGTAAGELMRAVTDEMSRDKPSNAKMHALWKLKSRVDDIWMNIQNKYNFSTALVFDDSTKQEYISNIWNPFVEMNKLTSQYILGKVSEDSFIMNCRADVKSPVVVLGYIREMFVDSCNYPIKPSIAKLIGDYRSFIMQILRRFKVESGDMPDAGEYMEEFWKIYHLLGQQSVLEANFDVYNQSTKTYSEAIARFQKEVTQMGVTSKSVMIPYRTGCPLQAHMYKTNFNHEQVEVYVSKLVNILFDVSLQAGVCGHAMFKNQPEQLEKYIETLSERITFVTSFVSRWFSDSLKAAWPVAHHQIVKEEMIRLNVSYADIMSCMPSLDKIVGQEECKKKLAALQIAIISKLKSTGFPNYSYKMLVLADSENLEHIKCQDGEQNYCSMEKETTRLDTVIRRKHAIPVERMKNHHSLLLVEPKRQTNWKKISRASISDSNHSTFLKNFMASIFL